MSDAQNLPLLVLIKMSLVFHWRNALYFCCHWCLNCLLTYLAHCLIIDLNSEIIINFFFWIFDLSCIERQDLLVIIFFLKHLFGYIYTLRNLYIVIIKLPINGGSIVSLVRQWCCVSVLVGSRTKKLRQQQLEVGVQAMWQSLYTNNSKYVHKRIAI